ncbi:MAG: leucyl aminopeptidase [Acidobacteriaceae bacterium]|nr:leucyl aminopeptidase [Acidobacteriaceae bacterium]
MQIHIETSPIETVSVDALAVICFETEEKKEGERQAPAAADPAIAEQSGWLADLRASGEFTGKLYETATLHRPKGVAARRLVVAGGGKREKFSSVEVRRLAGTLVRSLKGKGVRSVALLLDTPNGDEYVAPAVEGAILGAWEPDTYKTDSKKNENQVEAFNVAVPGVAAQALQAAAERGRIVGEAQNFARNLINEPANKLTPEELANRAKSMAKEAGLESEVLDQRALAELGMGALLGVAQGSSNPPVFIVLRYRPAGYQGKDHLAFVGKGVTFDTGGVSIKPSDGMEKMKYDMSGAAAAIGAMQAIARLKPPIPVTAYVPAVENMVSGNAQRPGDIVTTLAGKTVEVLNTDAEGRLILADAITYANRNGATHIVDAATLTGAITVALGHYNVGAFTNNEEFLERFLKVAKAAGEKTWQMPMDEEYKEYLKSAFADLPNIGGRYAGSITAAWFLREFADPTPWVHLDIAGTAWIDDGKSWLSKGPTGVAVRSFVELALDWNRIPGLAD